MLSTYLLPFLLAFIRPSYEIRCGTCIQLEFSSNWRDLDINSADPWKGSTNARLNFDCIRDLFDLPANHSHTDKIYLCGRQFHLLLMHMDIEQHLLKPPKFESTKVIFQLYTGEASFLYEKFDFAKYDGRCSIYTDWIPSQSVLEVKNTTAVDVKALKRDLGSKIFLNGLTKPFQITGFHEYSVEVELNQPENSITFAAVLECHLGHIPFYLSSAYLYKLNTSDSQTDVLKTRNVQLFAVPQSAGLQGGLSNRAQALLYWNGPLSWRDHFPTGYEVQCQRRLNGHSMTFFETVTWRKQRSVILDTGSAYQDYRNGTLTCQVGALHQPKVIVRDLLQNLRPAPHLLLSFNECESNGSPCAFIMDVLTGSDPTEPNERAKKPFQFVDYDHYGELEWLDLRNNSLQNRTADSKKGFSACRDWVSAIWFVADLCGPQTTSKDVCIYEIRSSFSKKVILRLGENLKKVRLHCNAIKGTIIWSKEDANGKISIRTLEIFSGRDENFFSVQNCGCTNQKTSSIAISLDFRIKDRPRLIFVANEGIMSADLGGCNCLLISRFSNAQSINFVAIDWHYIYWVAKINAKQKRQTSQSLLYYKNFENGDIQTLESAKWKLTPVPLENLAKVPGYPTHYAEGISFKNLQNMVPYIPGDFRPIPPPYCYMPETRDDNVISYHRTAEENLHITLNFPCKRSILCGASCAPSQHQIFLKPLDTLDEMDQSLTRIEEMGGVNFPQPTSVCDSNLYVESGCELVLSGLTDEQKINFTVPINQTMPGYLIEAIVYRPTIFPKAASVVFDTVFDSNVTRPLPPTGNPSAKDDPETSLLMVKIIIPILLILLLLLLLCVLCYFCSGRLRRFTDRVHGIEETDIIFGELLGQGSESKVYKALAPQILALNYTRLNRTPFTTLRKRSDRRKRFQDNITVAAKCVKSDEARKLILHDVRHLRQLYHGHILKVIWLLRGSDRLIVLYELMENRSLKDIFQEFTLSPMRLIIIARQISEACWHLERLNLVHCDLQLKNCFCTGLWTHRLISKLGAFDHAKPVGDTFGEVVSYPHTAPELFEVDAIATTRSDSFAFATFLWELYTQGQIPYEGIEEEEIRQRTLAGLRLTEWHDGFSPFASAKSRDAPRSADGASLSTRDAPLSTGYTPRDTWSSAFEKSALPKAVESKGLTVQPENDLENGTELDRDAPESTGYDQSLPYDTTVKSGYATELPTSSRYKPAFVHDSSGLANSDYAQEPPEEFPSSSRVASPSSGYAAVSSIEVPGSSREAPNSIDYETFASRELPPPSDYMRNTPQTVLTLMQECWRHLAHERPDFSLIVPDLLECERDVKLQINIDNRTRSTYGDCHHLNDSGGEIGSAVGSGRSCSHQTVYNTNTTYVNLKLTDATLTISEKVQIDGDGIDCAEAKMWIDS